MLKSILINDNFILIFLFIFFIQAALIISIMIFPQYIYSESMRDKHEVYLAYQYSVFDIIIGKSLILTFLSLLPAYIFVFSFFSYLFKFSIVSLFTILFVIPFLAFSIISFNVFASWFSKLGKVSNILIILLIVLGFSKIKNIIQTISKIPDYYIPVFGFLLSFLLFTLIFVFSKITKKEKIILKS